MSVAVVLPYFRTHAQSLGYIEHTDAFNVENIGSTRLNKSFHLELGETRLASLMMPNAVELETSVTVRMFLKGFRDTVTGRDALVVDAMTLVKRALKASNKIGASIKNVRFGTFSIEALNASNDNSLVSTINFTASVVTDVEGV